MSPFKIKESRSRRPLAPPQGARHRPVSPAAVGESPPARTTRDAPAHGARPRIARAGWPAAALAVATVAAGLLTALALAGSPQAPASFIVAAVATAWGFVAVGLYAFARRPDSGVGTLMVTFGFSWLLVSLQKSALPLPHTAGLLANSVWGAIFVHLLLSMGEGRLPGWRERVVVLASYVTAVILQPLPFLFAPYFRPRCPDCAENLAVVRADWELAGVLLDLHVTVVCVLAVATGALLVEHWRTANPLQRRALAPVLASGLLTAVLICTSASLELAGVLGLSDVLGWVFWYSTALLPVAFFVGLARSRFALGEALGRFLERLNAAPGEAGKLRQALSETLGDPSLAVAYYMPQDDRYVDAHGRVVALPGRGESRTCTIIDHGGRRLAALVHAEWLRGERELVRAAGTAAALELERERLDAELRARLEELRASRARIVRAGDEERRRIERDLHDGAQHHLASLLLQVKLERRHLRGEDAAAATLLDTVESGLVEGIEELRRIAAGILPPVLTERGLGAAVAELARRSPVDVRLCAMPSERLRPSVEVAAYFVIAEALANVAKHARAGVATVAVTCEDGRVAIEVVDDGVGGATAERGSGLRGLADRVGALDGRLRVHSEPGRGTRLRAEIPCALS